MPRSQTLFTIDGESFLSGTLSVELTGERGGEVAAFYTELMQYYAAWQSGRDHAPPWRIVHRGLGFLIAPVRAPLVEHCHQLPANRVAADGMSIDGVIGDRALSVTLDSLSLSGAALAPILRGLCDFTQELTAAMDSRWMVWGPARLAYSPALLGEQLAMWDTGNLIPLLAFVAFHHGAAHGRTDENSNEAAVHYTRGMGFFGAAEIHLTANTPLHPADAVRRMTRIAYAMIADPRRDVDGDYDGLIPGEVMTIRRRSDGVHIHCVLPR